MILSLTKKSLRFGFHFLLEKHFENYHNFEVARGSSNTAAVQFQSTSAGQGSNVFFNFIDKSSLLAHDINFLEGSPQTFQNFNVRGASGTERIRFVAETVNTTTSLVKIGVGGDNLAIVSGAINVLDEPRNAHNTSWLNLSSPRTDFCSAAHFSSLPGIFQ